VEYRRPDTIPFPSDNPYTPEKALLGRTLFHDTRLSAPGALACASCHNAGFSYGDGLPASLGNAMKPLPRRSLSILNSAWGELYMWDGRAASLEAQALGPITAPAEMNQALDQLPAVLSAIRDYKPLFAAAFPRQAITPERTAQAIATYERTIVSAPAPFDAWIEGDATAIPAAAQRGFALFDGSARCALCHSGWRFTDDGFHDIGLPDADQGRGRLLPRVIKMRHAFKTPGLREIALRGPYMHDGSLPTLDAVVAHYNQGGIDRPSRSELIGPLALSAREQADIVAFLRTLTSAASPEIVAALPR
jgi:cytochrome c peroxidase